MAVAQPLTKETESALNEIVIQDHDLFDRFNSVIEIEPELNRQLVSFQANKSEGVYRWYKFKEGFSAALVRYIFERFRICDGPILDPFAGGGTTLFASSQMGLDSIGVEVLPIGQKIIEARQVANNLTSPQMDHLGRWIEETPWKTTGKRVHVPELRITRGAYSEQTRDAIERYVWQADQEPSEIRTILRFALLCILESVSYTRKDGQYLRWDHRSGRRQGRRPFDKGHIANFDDAIVSKLQDILLDLRWSHHLDTRVKADAANIKLVPGSCLSALMEFKDDEFSGIMTSPPYCNRYDYTRTYALELALLETSEEALINLRQSMLSCTVENREKDLLNLNPSWCKAIKVADGQQLLQSILAHLNQEKAAKRLNNNGIPRMVKGYFYEMACVIYECARVLRSGSRMIMVNDNVRYAGASISVDLILSSMAEELGFETEHILVLPKGKGNSSQQMGTHGRDALRKCVYVWRRR